MQRQVVKPLSYLEISRSNLLHNISEFRKCMPAGTKLAAVVKGNAYGHGIDTVVPLIGEYADYFQVDDIEELRAVKRLSKTPALIFGYVRKDDLEEAASLGDIFGVYDEERIRFLNEVGRKSGRKITIHLKIDAFLGRQGILASEVQQMIDVIKECPYVELEALYSHFSNIEDTERLDHAKLQHSTLLGAKAVAQKHFPEVKHHISATSGIMSDTEENWGSHILRLGMGLYGLWPSRALEEKQASTLRLKPVMKWVTHVAQIKNLPEGFPVGYGLTFVTKRKTVLAIIPQGYSDGFDRKFSNSGSVLIGGKRAPVVGRVAMNMFMVDVTDIPGVKVEDEVVILGSQGGGVIGAEELAEPIGRINYEIISRISPFLPRIVV